MPRKYKCVPKSQRQSSKLWAEGIRETVLAPHLEVIADAMARGHIAGQQALQHVCREYHAKIPWSLEDHEELTLPLLAFDSNAPPVPETLTGDELKAKRKRIDFSNGHIKRWYKYRVKHLHKGTWRNKTSLDDPLMHVRAKISGHKRPPKARSGQQQFSMENYQTVVAAAVEKLLKDDPTLQDTMELRVSVTKQFYNALSKDEKKGYEKTAKADALAAKKKYKKALKAPVSQKPEDRQRVIDGTVSFFAPVLSAYREASSLQVMLVVSGPRPNLGGDIGTKHVLAGTDLLHGVPFNRWHVDHFEKEIITPYKEYLIGAYSDEEKKAAALPKKDTPGLKRGHWEEDSVGDDDDDDDGSGSGSSSGNKEDDDSVANEEDEEQAGQKRKRSAGDEDGGREKAETDKVKGTSKVVLKRNPVGKGKKGKEKEVTSAASLKVGPPVSAKKMLKPKPAGKAAKTGSISREEPSTSLKNTAMGDDVLGMQVDPSFLRPIPSAEVLTGIPESEVDFLDFKFIAAWNAAGRGGLDTEMQEAEKKKSLETEPIAEQDKEGAVVPWALMMLPVDAAEWFVQLHAEFTKSEVDPRVDKLISIWTELEGLYEWEDERAALKAGSRPAELGTWIKAGQTCAGNKRPHITSLKTFMMDWWSWWQLQQPSWRKMGGMVKYDWDQGEYGDEWVSLRLPGKNNLASIVAVLIWWGQDLKEAEKEKMVATSYMWDMALQDVIWMVQGLLEHEKAKKMDTIV
ncbi:hypothetical protein C8J56DRAFT_886195 [Mycena floridula]|nr:hypothetical protein C8J56DRAFT_886195 [Mycena floridula]